MLESLSWVTRKEKIRFLDSLTDQNAYNVIYAESPQTVPDSTKFVADPAKSAFCSVFQQYSFFNCFFFREIQNSRSKTKARRSSVITRNRLLIIQEFFRKSWKNVKTKTEVYCVY